VRDPAGRSGACPRRTAASSSARPLVTKLERHCPSPILGKSEGNAFFSRELTRPSGGRRPLTLARQPSRKVHCRPGSASRSLDDDTKRLSPGRRPCWADKSRLASSSNVGRRRQRVALPPSAANARILSTIGTSSRHPTLVFQHALTQDVASARCSPEFDGSSLRAVAPSSTLSRSAGASPGLLARHALAATFLGRAVEYLSPSGRLFWRRSRAGRFERLDQALENGVASLAPHVETDAPLHRSGGSPFTPRFSSSETCPG